MCVPRLTQVAEAVVSASITNAQRLHDVESQVDSLPASGVGAKHPAVLHVFVFVRDALLSEDAAGATE